MELHYPMKGPEGRRKYDIDNKASEVLAAAEGALGQCAHHAANDVVGSVWNTLHSQLCVERIDNMKRADNHQGEANSID